MTLQQVIDASKALLALTRDETTREKIFVDSSFQSLPQSIRDLADNQPTRHFFLAPPPHERSANQLFDTIAHVAYYATNVTMAAVYDPQGEGQEELIQSLELLDIALRLINNTAFVHDLVPSRPHAFPISVLKILATIAVVFESVLNQTHFVTLPNLFSQHLPADNTNNMITQFTSEWERLQTKVGSTTTPGTTTTLPPSNPQLCAAITLYLTVCTTITERYGEAYSALTAAAIQPSLLNGLANQKYEELPYGYQIFYMVITTIVLYIKAVGFTPNETPDDPSLALATIKTLLIGMTQVVNNIVPETSTTQTIQHASLQHPFLISIRPLLTAMIETFTPLNVQRQFNNNHNNNNNNNNHPAADEQFLIGTKWPEQLKSNYTTHFNQSAIFGSEHPPAWVSINTITTTPNIATLFYLIISSTMTKQSEPAAATATTTISQLLAPQHTTNLSAQVQSMLLRSVPHLLGMIGEFTSNQISTCYNCYIAPESTQAPIITNPNEPATVPQNHSSSPQLSPQEQKLQQAKAQTHINNAISNYFLTTTPLITLILGGLAIRNQQQRHIHLHQSFDDIKQSYLDHTIEMMQSYDAIPEYHGADNHPITTATTAAIAVDYLYQSLSETFPADPNGQAMTKPLLPLPTVWDENLLDVTKMALTLPNHPNPTPAEDYDDDEMNALVVLQHEFDNCQSPLLATAPIIKSLTTSIMLCKFINIPSSGKPLTQQQLQKQQQSVSVVASEATPLINTQQHFNYLTRHIYPFFFAEIANQISAQSQWYGERIGTETTSALIAASPQHKSSTITILILQALLQRNMVALSDVFTALAPIALSALPSQFFLHSTAPMITILTMLHSTIGFFLQIPIKPYLPVMFPLLVTAPGLSADTNSLLNAFGGQFSAIHPKPQRVTPLLKIMSSLCYRAMTLLGYFMGNCLPPTNPILYQQHPQLLVITTEIMSPTNVFVSLHYTYYYLQHFIYKKTVGDFRTNPTGLIKASDGPTTPNTTFKQSFQYQLILNFDPPIIEVVEGLLTLMLNSALYFQRKPFTNDIAISLNKLGQQQILQSVMESISHAPSSSSATATTTTATNSPLTLLVHPLSLVFTPITFSFLLRLLTLGWDGDDERYGEYLDPETQFLITPNATQQLPESRQHPQEVRLIHNVFHQLFSQVYVASLDQQQQQQSSLAPTAAQTLIKADFFPSPLDSLPAHVLHHKLPNFQAPTLRLLRCAFDTLTTYFTKPTTKALLSQSTNAIINVPVANTALLTPYFNVLTPLRIAELLTSLYALTKFCPIPTLRYESARTFSHMTRLFGTVQRMTTVESAAQRLVQLNAIVVAAEGTTGIPSSWVPGPFDTGALYLARSCQSMSNNNNNNDKGLVGDALKQLLLGSIVTFENFAQLVQYQFEVTDAASPSTTITTTTRNGPMKPGTKKPTLEQQQPQPRLFQELLQILLMNSVTADGQMLVQEAHAALQSLDLTP